jgi:hypothetical protein
MYLALNYQSLKNVYLECSDGRSEDENSGVEAVGPTGVRSRGKLVAIEKLIAVLQNLKIVLNTIL